MARIVLICSKADMNAPDFRDPLQRIVKTYELYKGVSKDEILYFVSPNLTLPDINNQMTSNIFIFQGLMANGIGQPEGMHWKADIYSEGGYYFTVFDIQL